MPTQRQIKKAARLWSLALVASVDGMDEGEVRKEARRAAFATLERMGFDPYSLTDEAACLRAALTEELPPPQPAAVPLE